MGIPRVRSLALPLSVVAGLLGAAAFPPLGVWPLSIVSVALFLLLLRPCGAVRAALLGFVYGLAYAAGTMYWMVGIFGWLALAFMLMIAGYFLLVAFCIGTTRGWDPWARAVLVGIFAVAEEWLRGDAWFIRFPWYSVPHALAAVPVCIAPVRWLGTYGLSFLIWTIAAWGAYGRIYAWGAFALLPLCALFLPAIQPPSQRALLIQAEDEVDLAAVLDKVPYGRVDLAVLPEYAYYRSPQEALELDPGPATLARKTTSPVVFGAVDGDPHDADFQNEAAVIDATGRLVGTFPKQHPVPFMGDGKPGGRRPVFPMAQGTLGVAICYDFDAPAVAGSLVEQGATVLVAPTCDMLSWGKTQHVEHDLLMRLRAVENDRWLVRAVSSGRSEAIGPDGVPSAEGVPIGDVGSVVVGYAHRTGIPLGSRLYVLGPLAAGLSVCVVALRVLVAILRRRARPGSVS